MPGVIPEPFKWNKDFQTFYANIDAEHKTLFDGIFRLAEDRNEGARVALEQVTVTHFTNEEGMMKAKNYADYHSHKEKHDAFVAKLKSWKDATFADADLHYAKDWLVNHIVDTDFHYKGKL